MPEPVVIGNATLYLGDCREVLPSLAPVDAIITDPVWPNCPPGMLPGSEDPDSLFREFCGLAPECRQLVVCLRSDCDPRLLRHVPARLPFQQCVWCPYVVPGYTGRTLGGNEIAYAFGQPIPSLPGQRIIPGQAPKVQPWDRAMQNDNDKHPCPRDVRHQKFLVRWFSNPDGIVLDPFMGSGTTALACLALGRAFIGVEIEPRYFDLACRRIEEARRQPDMFFPHAIAEQLTLA